MGHVEMNFNISKLGESRIPSPMRGVRFVRDDEHVVIHSGFKEIKEFFERGEQPPFLEAAGPREKIYCDPSKLKCGIVTCGGLCPGLNDVIRAIVMSLYHHYGVKTVYGFPYGYEGLAPKYGHQPLELTPQASGASMKSEGPFSVPHGEIRMCHRWSIPWSEWGSASCSPSGEMERFGVPMRSVKR